MATENLIVVKSLPIKEVTSAQEAGSIYTVLEVGIVMLKRDSFEIIKVLDEDGIATWYRLPDQYMNFVFDSLTMARGGLNMFPSRVEFKRYDGQYAVNILEGVKL